MSLIQDESQESPLDLGCLENLNNSAMMSDGSCNEEDEITAELIDEIERLQEAVIEEFLERAYTVKYERSEELRAQFKKEKKPMAE